MPQTETAEMITTTAVGKFLATAGTERRLQIMDRREAACADHLPLAGKTNPTAGTAAGKDKLHAATGPFLPGNHRGSKTKNNMNRRKRTLLLLND